MKEISLDDVTKDGVAAVLGAVAASLNEAYPQIPEPSENPMLVIMNAHMNAFVDGTSPLRVHQALEPMDVATVMALQKFLNDAVKERHFDFLIP